MVNTHGYAVQIESILRKVFDCDRGGVAGLIDASFIESNCYAAIATGLGYLYSDDSKKSAVESFIKRFGFYLELGITNLLSFDSNEKIINGCTYQIDYDNGKKALDEIIQELSNLCR